MVDRPDPVGPHRSTEQSVFLRLDVDQVEHVSANIVHPGVERFRNQPVADGPAGPDRRRRPVGTDGRHAVHDEDRPTAGGPVGRFPNSDPLKASKMSSLDEPYQPLAAGSLDANGMYTVNDPCRTTAGGPLGRLFSLDPMGPRGMSSLGDENQPPSVGSLGKPLMTERLGDRAGEPDYKRTTQTRSESESDTGVPDSVIQTRSLVHTGRVNISMANGLTDSSVIPHSSDSVVHSLGERTTQTRSESESVTGVRDPVIQMGSEVQTDRVNISTDNGLTDSRETSPSSDSGVHSWTEQWENMSENSTYSSLYHTVECLREGRIPCASKYGGRRRFRLSRHRRIIGEEVGRMPVRRDVRRGR